MQEKVNMDGIRILLKKTDHQKMILLTWNFYTFSAKYALETKKNVSILNADCWLVFLTIYFTFGMFWNLT